MDLFGDNTTSKIIEIPLIHSPTLDRYIWLKTKMVNTQPKVFTLLASL